MDPASHRLVVLALTCTLSNCVEWTNDKEANRVQSDQANQGLSPEEIKELVRAYVRLRGPLVLNNCAKIERIGDACGNTGIE